MILSKKEESYQQDNLKLQTFLKLQKGKYHEKNR